MEKNAVISDQLSAIGGCAPFLCNLFGCFAFLTYDTKTGTGD